MDPLRPLIGHVADNSKAKRISTYVTASTSMELAMVEIRVKVTQYADRKYLVMYYTDPVTHKVVTRSTKTTSQREAERAAALWQVDLNSGQLRVDARISWKVFRQRYENEKLSSLALKSQTAAATAFTHLESLVNPARLSSLTDEVLSTFQSKLRATQIRETSIASYLRQIKAALSWAASMGFLVRPPKIHMPKRIKGRTLMRGRPINEQEFQTLLNAVPKIRPHDAEAWKYYLTGLWLSGLRLEESTLLSWDEASPIWVDFSGRYPQLRIYAEAEKGNRDRKLPITPDFMSFLDQTPGELRTGKIFNLVSLQTKRRFTARTIGRFVSRIGKQANLIVDKRENRYVTAHDLRRSFGTRWAAKVKPATLRMLMRHRSVETTMKYYVDMDADDIGDELWQKAGLNNSINSRTPSKPDASDGQDI